MMQFMHSLPSGRSLALAPRGAAILFAALAGGCSAEISRFDFPTFSLTGEKQNETASLQSSNRSPGDRQTAANGYGGYDRGGYTAPRDNRDGGVAMSKLPDASPSTPASSKPKVRCSPGHSPAARCWIRGHRRSHLDTWCWR